MLRTLLLLLGLLRTLLVTLHELLFTLGSDRLQHVLHVLENLRKLVALERRLRQQIRHLRQNRLSHHHGSELLSDGRVAARHHRYQGGIAVRRQELLVHVQHLVLNLLLLEDGKQLA